jgi:uncharacterized membrane protein YgcG
MLSGCEASPGPPSCHTRLVRPLTTPLLAPSNRLPLVACKAGASDAFARLLERIERQVGEVLGLHEKQLCALQRQQQQQEGLDEGQGGVGGPTPQQRGGQPQPQPQPQPQHAGSGGLLRPGGGNVPQPASAQGPEPKRQKRSSGGGSGGGGSGGGGSGGGGSGGGGGWLEGAAAVGGSGNSHSASPEVLIQWLLQKYLQAEDKVAAAAAAAASDKRAATAGEAGTAAAAAGRPAAAAGAGTEGGASPRAPGAWRVGLVAMLQRVPALHAPLLSALALAVEGAAAPGSGAVRRGRSAAALLATMAACWSVQEAIISAGSQGPPKPGARPEVELAGCTQACHSWRFSLEPRGSSSGGAAADGSNSSGRGGGGGEAPLERLPHVAWPRGVPGPPGAPGGSSPPPQEGPAAGGDVLARALLARCRLGLPAQLAGAAAFWAAYLEHAAAGGWWCTAGERATAASACTRDHRPHLGGGCVRGSAAHLTESSTPLQRVGC